MSADVDQFAPSALVMAERAAGELRRGQPVVVRQLGGAHTMIAAIERTDTAQLEAFRSAATEGKVRLVLTPERAATLKVRQYTDDAIEMKVPRDLTIADLKAIADPVDDLTAPMKGPFSTLRAPDANGIAGMAGVTLAKRAGLLPAVLLIDITEAPDGPVQISAEDVFAAADQETSTLARVTQARVPIEGAEDARLVGFRPPGGGPDHFALVIGEIRAGQTVLTRLHSECFTGDLLGSLKCDCGPQLRGALARIVREGSGVLLYLSQEGRGIGLMNKLRAYNLQDQGFDTVEANQRLGFEIDERRFGMAAEMLRLLSIGRVRLLTNNPDKIDQLEAHGIGVDGRVPLVFSPNTHNEDYLKTKAEKTGHLL